MRSPTNIFNPATLCVCLSHVKSLQLVFSGYLLFMSVIFVILSYAVTFKLFHIIYVEVLYGRLYGSCIFSQHLLKVILRRKLYYKQNKDIRILLRPRHTG